MVISRRLTKAKESYSQTAFRNSQIRIQHRIQDCDRPSDSEFHQQSLQIPVEKLKSYGLKKGHFTKLDIAMQRPFRMSTSYPAMPR